MLRTWPPPGRKRACPEPSAPRRGALGVGSPQARACGAGPPTRVRRKARAVQRRAEGSGAVRGAEVGARRGRGGWTRGVRVSQSSCADRRHGRTERGDTGGA
ncbi:hypothetical protein NN561_018498 [Cricetulus griseus]